MTRIVDDDEAEIEAEIQRQLDEISVENLEIEDFDDTSTSFEINKKVTQLSSIRRCRLAICSSIYVFEWILDFF